MRKILVIALTVLLSLPLGAQGIHLCKEAPFQDGEKLEMVLMFKWGLVNTEVGSVSTSITQSGNLFHASCQLRTAPFFDAFYKMREHFQSDFTVDGHRPVVATRDTYQNGYTANNRFRFDWKAGVIHANLAYSGKEPETKDIPLNGKKPYDVVSLIYLFRNMEWDGCKKGESSIVPGIVDDQVIDLRVTYQGPDKIKVRKQGQFSANRFSCTVVAGHLFEGDQEVQVWVSDDENHIPLAIMLPLKMGTMWLWLKKWDGLKYDLTSKLK